ncbi:hypothetical protein [Sphaerimonospora thailandensis]|uniref:SWIM-type domain-containing protein n=1 Tax=Sphaerimonospora thailandensis TaxID=795644 RepID=A0A8J3R7W8_9ACTN|nr:hypothetical protein [Sphaerimonospora thailandensis]GIH69480.1 hypothetical protein Mth01_17330 [Sphaerimonospora thailandensis]
MATDTRSRALAYIREGRAVIRAASYGGTAPLRVAAVAYGHTGRHEISLRDGEWSCTCPATGICPHIAAIGLVCGRPDLAARTPNPDTPRTNRTEEETP